METLSQEEKQKQYLETVFVQYFKNKKAFCETVYYRAVAQVASGNINVHFELMETSDLFLKKSRDGGISEEFSVKYRELSFELRKIAQKIYYKHDLTYNERFLKLAS